METIIRIAELLGAAIAAGWITRIITIRSRVRQEQAEADKAETAVKADQIENLEATIKKVYDPIIERLTKRVNEMEEEMEGLRNENAALKLENQELRKEVDLLRSQALFRNTNRSRDGKFAKVETKNAAAPKKQVTK